MFEVAVEVIAKAAYADNHNHQVEFVPDAAESFHVFAEIDSYPGEEVTPD